MARVILCLFVLAALFYSLFKDLINQSKHPSGFIGRIMMRIWNKAYLPMAQWALSVLPKKSYENILDIGVGNGASTAYLGQLFPNSQVRGLDISTEAISQAQQRYQQENITFEVMDVSQLAYPDNSFDLVCAFQTHFHWPDLEQAMLEIKRVLTNDGFFIYSLRAKQDQLLFARLERKRRFCQLLE